MSRVAIKKNQESARDLADMMRKFMSDMAASGIGADSSSDSPMTFPYATSNDVYKRGDEGDAEDEDDYELDNNFEYVPVNEAEDEEKEESNDPVNKKEKIDDEKKKKTVGRGLEDTKKKDVAEKKGEKEKKDTAEVDQQDAAAAKPEATNSSSPAPSGKIPMAPTHTPKKRKIPAAMLGNKDSNVTSLRRSSRTKHKTLRYTFPAKEEPGKTERPVVRVSDDHTMTHFTRLMPKMVCKHCDEEVLASRGVAQKHLDSCSVFSSMKFLSKN
ncbi:hypothetical protein P3T76_011739 [Phytophthora citrophthora]|uniref:Uncharacterized protein n=1 Tax=Phytophthora citrophthora TaxID=4793 RepID=A0AAD9G8R4_9STRA|nr:hypothetical protein P3T76_011739 [Phytophthora citrophthora]